MLPGNLCSGEGVKVLSDDGKGLQRGQGESLGQPQVQGEGEAVAPWGWGRKATGVPGDHCLLLEVKGEVASEKKGTADSQGMRSVERVGVRFEELFTEVSVVEARGAES